MRLHALNADGSAKVFGAIPVLVDATTSHTVQSHIHLVALLIVSQPPPCLSRVYSSTVLKFLSVEAKLNHQINEAIIPRTNE